MTKPNHVEASVQPPTKSALGLTAEQMDALAKVYRLLLSIQGKKASGEVSKNPTSPESAPQTESLSHPPAEPSDE